MLYEVITLAGEGFYVTTPELPTLPYKPENPIRIGFSG